MSYAKHCEHCGQAFTARKPDAKYCNVNCRNMAYQVRKAGLPVWEDADKRARKVEDHARRLRAIADRVKPADSLTQ